MHDIRAVIFDMGGVVVRLSSLPDVLAGAGIPETEIWERWILSEAVRRFERGRCTVREFADDLIDEFGVELSADELIARFSRFPIGLYDGAEQLLADTRAVCPIGILSNTNELHWTTQPGHEFLQNAFDHEYLSYAVGLVKPDADIYEHVLADLGLEAHQVLFLDDNKVNVDGATAVGMLGAVAKGPEQARAALVEFGVLS